MPTKFIKIVFILIAVLLCAGCVAAPDISYATIEKSGYFISGYDPDLSHTYDGYGLAINIVREAAGRMGVRTSIKPVNNYDWQARLENGTIDVMLCATSGEHLNSTVLFTDDILLVTNKETSIQQIGVIDSAPCIAQKNILSYSTDYIYVYYSNPALLMGDIALNIVDGGIMSEYDAYADPLISHYTLQTLSQAPITFVVSNKSQTFYDELNTILTQMVNDGTIDRLKKEAISALQ